MSKRIQPFTAVSALWRVVTARVVCIVLRLGVFGLPPPPERAPLLSRSLSRPQSSACLHAHGLARSCGSWCERRGKCSWHMMCIRMRLWLTIFIVRCRLKPPPCFEPLLERMRGCAYFPWRGAGWVGHLTTFNGVHVLRAGEGAVGVFRFGRGTSTGMDR